MKVFIGWSGDISRQVAEALHWWLPHLINAVDPWMSEEDLGKGMRWSPELARQLKETNVGIITLTPENLTAPWILFEAGAISKVMDESYLFPFLFKLDKSNVSGPLTQFQMTKAEKKDTRKLINTINSTLDDKGRSKADLDEAFDMWWPRLKDRLDEIRVPEEVTDAIGDRGPLEIMKEVLESVRSIQRQLAVIEAETTNDDVTLRKAKALYQDFCDRLEQLKITLENTDDLYLPKVIDSLAEIQALNSMLHEIGYPIDTSTSLLRQVCVLRADDLLTKGNGSTR